MFLCFAKDKTLHPYAKVSSMTIVS